MTTPTATLRIRFDTEAEAERVAQALAADDDAFATTRRDHTTLIVEAHGANVPSLLRTLDDVLANASISEAVIKRPPLDE